MDTEKMDLHVVPAAAKTLCSGIRDRSRGQLHGSAFLSNVVCTWTGWEKLELRDSRLSDRTCRGEEELYVLLNIHRCGWLSKDRSVVEEIHPLIII